MWRLIGTGDAWVDSMSSRVGWSVAEGSRWGREGPQPYPCGGWIRGQALGIRSRSTRIPIPKQPLRPWIGLLPRLPPRVATISMRFGRSP